MEANAEPTSTPIRNKYGLLGLGVLFLIVMVTCSATPIVWILLGRPSESYPELFFISWGLPAGFTLLLAGILVTLLNPTTNQWSRRGIALIKCSAYSIIATICAVPALMTIGNQFVFDLYFISVPVLFVLIIIGGLMARRQGQLK